MKSARWFIAALIAVGASHAVLAQEEAAPAATTEQTVQSEAIEKISYDADTKTLTVTFDVGGTFEYANVPAEVHDALVNAESKGNYFTENIKGKYESKKISE